MGNYTSENLFDFQKDIETKDHIRMDQLDSAATLFYGNTIALIKLR